MRHDDKSAEGYGHSKNPVEPYPLKWPQWRPRTESLTASRFARYHTIHDAVCEILRQIDLMGGKFVVISTDLRLKLDGFPRSGQPNPEDVGASVWFRWRGQPQCFACDAWDRIVCNLWAIAKTIEAVRGIERWGSGAMMAQAMTAFLALPPAITPPVPWWVVIGAPRHGPLDLVEDVYRTMIRAYHPDRPDGSAEKTAELTRAIREAREELR